MMSEGFRIRGVHVLAAIVAFFAVIIAVNAVFLTFAIKSFPGEYEKKSYMQGLNYNERLTARGAQDALGWTADITEARLEGSEAIIVLAFKSKDAAPILGLEVAATLERAVDDDNDIALSFSPAAPGAYRAVGAEAAPGQWRLKGAAEDAGETAFEFETMLYLE